jgi:hypothetical protein
MGDVARVLSTRVETLLQSLMHDRIVVEACENIHLHWRNVRLEMSVSDSVRLVDACWRFTKLACFLQGRVVSIPLASICPYDPRHLRTVDGSFEAESPADTAEHEAGIAWIIEQMQAGRRPWPIAIRPAWCGHFSRPEDKRPGNVWQRLDGFKRHMAHKRLGLTAIDCFIVADNLPGCQHEHRAFLEEGEELPRGFPANFFMQAGEDRLSLVNAEKQRYMMNQVELLRNGTIHLHIGDIRLEFERAEFLTFADMIQEARAAL